MSNAKRIHGIEAAGAGDLGKIGELDAEEQVGPCPDCGAEIREGSIVNPNTGVRMRGLLHPVPFCTYFGETDAEEIRKEIERRRS